MLYYKPYYKYQNVVSLSYFVAFFCPDFLLAGCMVRATLPTAGARDFPTSPNNSNQTPKSLIFFDSANINKIF